MIKNIIFYMILYFLIGAFYVNIEKLYKKLDLNSQNRTFTFITKYFCDFFYNIKYYIYHDINNVKQYNNILLICNHINFLDNMILIRYCLEYFPEYSIHFVYGDCSNKIPFIKEYLKTYYISSSELNNKDDFESKINFLNNISKKKIIILFPEGKLLLERYKLKSIEYCIKNKIKLNHLLCPYQTGYEILKHQTDIILDVTIMYSKLNNYINKSNIFGNYILSDLNDNPPFTSVRECIFNYMPKSVHIFTKITNKNNLIYDIWKDKDKHINNITTYNLKITPNQIINKYMEIYYIITFLPIFYLLYYFNN